MGSRIADDLRNAANGGDYDEFQKLIKQLQKTSDSRQIPVLPAARPLGRMGNDDKAASSKRLAMSSRARQARPAQPSIELDRWPANWGDDFRAIPNELIRTALFTIRRNEPRQSLANAQIAAMRNTVMLYSGDELRMKDEDVLMQTFQFQRDFPIGQAWVVNGRDYLKSMHWTDGKRGYYELYASLHRLSKGHITILRRGENGDQFVLEAGAILAQLKIEHGGRSGPSAITLQVNPDTRKLWDSMGYTLVNLDQRLRLKGPLARYLHRFYSSHQQPFAFKAATLLQLTGSTATLNKFRQLLRQSLQDLCDIGFLQAFWVDSSDLVHVTRVQQLAHQQ